MSAGGYFLKALLVLPAQLLHPLGRSLFQFGMILVFPGAGRRLEGFELPQAHQLLLRRLSEKGAASPLADHSVNFGHQLLGNHDVRAFGIHARPSGPE